MVVTTVALDRDLHQRLALAGIHTNTAINELIRQAIRQWLRRRGAPKKR